MVKVALIGAGNHCRINHAPALSQYAKDHADKVELIAVCDLEQNKADGFAKEYGFKTAYTNHREMIEKEQPDGCVCVMPIPLIVPLAKELMEMGMPVTIEKPPGASVEEGRELLAAAEKTGTPHMVSVNRRFQPFIAEGREWALSQGAIRFVRGSMLRHNRREDVFVSGTGIHSLDALRFIAGDVSRTETFTQNDGTPWHHFILHFESGALGTFDVLTTDGCAEERYEIYGEGYRVNMAVENSGEPRLQCWKDNELVVDKTPDPSEPNFVRIGPYAETHEFVTALIEKRAMWPTIADVFPSMALALELNP
ncbi:MAG: Gfo/Idh/MocA family oxidoreductase [Candidatus Latescibacteria bacterium]|nr:Gfo/Idh/MocA family oxidoreductase [Candidatus Latescibacterota bacterium]MBT4138683.1 Gfo/Idh/MocA family oxidoreductase [Candidatus Latescibacterota bacterium]MBT5831849.1 Gfo/Idh/MocA family oxidoreductase [Candidatus Latescibacterota bacterium]